MPCARPPAAAVAEALAAADRGLALRSSERQPLSLSPGRAGGIVRLECTRPGATSPSFRELAVLCAPPYLYTLQLETTDGGRLEALRAAFHGVIDSMEPVPSPEDRGPGPTPLPRALLEHWV
jgi:hypothetical protein